MGFAEKLILSISLGLIEPKYKNGYLTINKLRNKIAHSLHPDISFNYLFECAKIMSESGFEFSDETIYTDKKKAEEYYTPEAMIDEMVSWLAIYLMGDLMDNGVVIPQ